MTRVLVAWEQGEGLGHIGALGGILGRLPRHVELVAAVKDAERAAAWFPERTRFVDVPRWQRFAAPRTVTFGDVLYGIGWFDPGHLAEQVAWWRRTLRRSRADVVLADTCPTLLLAARGSERPIVNVSGPWGCPTGGHPMQPVFPDASAADRAAAHERERAIVAACNAVVPEAPLDGLADLWAPHHFFVKGPALTDPFAGRRAASVTHLGPMGVSVGGADTDYPPGQGRRVFAYLKGHYPALHDVLDTLAGGTGPALAVVVGHREVRRGPLRVTPTPVKLGPLLDRTDLVVTHSIVGTGYLALQASVPVLLLPTHTEQLANARKASELPGVGWLAPGAVRRELRPLLASFLQPQARLEAAATRRELTDWPDPFARVAQAVLEAA